MSTKSYKQYELHPFPMYDKKPIEKFGLDQKQALFDILNARGSNVTLRMKAIARRRLIELGCLIRYKKQVLKKWQYQAQLDKEFASRNEKHYFKDGERVELEVSCECKYEGISKYGAFFIYWMRDLNSDKLFYFFGSKYPFIGRKARIRATVKHKEYKGKKQTALQRIYVKEILD